MFTNCKSNSINQTTLDMHAFSGATLGKGLNRGLATLLAGALGVGAHHLANLSGQIGEPILLGFFVFLQGELLLFRILLYDWNECVPSFFSQII